MYLLVQLEAHTQAAKQVPFKIFNYYHYYYHLTIILLGETGSVNSPLGLPLHLVQKRTPRDYKNKVFYCVDGLLSPNLNAKALKGTKSFNSIHKN